MFGLTKREQMWKAEQRILETVAKLVVGVVQANTKCTCERCIRIDVEQLPDHKEGER